MKLPWDKQYLKIAFHVIFTLVVSYLAIVLIDGVAFVIADIFYIIGRFFAGLGWLINLFSPLVLSFLMAYLMDPLAEFYQELCEHFRDRILYPWLAQNTSIKLPLKPLIKKKPQGQPEFRTRFMGTALTYATILIGLSLLVRLVAQQFETEQIAAMVSEMAETVTLVVANVTDALDQFEMLLPLSDYLETLTELSIVWVTESLPDILTAAATTGAWILDFFIAFVVAFYFSTHKARIKHSLQNLLETFTPTKVNQVVRLVFADLHFVFSGYIRGMMLDGMILGFMIGVTLSILGVQLAIPIGIVTVIFNMIPFFGGIMAFILAVVSELILGTPTSALYAAIAIVIIQQIDSIFIIPKVVGENVKLSAPVVMLSLTIAGTLFGIMGMLLIVPTLAILKIFATRFLERYAAYQQQKRRTERRKQ